MRAPAPATGEIDLFNTDYAPGRRRRRRHRDRRRLAGGDPVQPVLPDPGHRGQRRVRRVGDPRDRSPTTTSTRRTSRPRSRPLENGGVKVPGDNGDAMTVTWKLRDGLKWSDGEPTSPATTSSTRGSGSWTRTTWASSPRASRTSTAWDCPSATRHGPPLRERVRGLHHDGGGARCRGTSSTQIPIADQVNGRRASGPTRSPRCPVSGAFKFESVTPRRRAPPRPQRRTTGAGRPASRPISTRSSSSGTATRTR